MPLEIGESVTLYVCGLTPYDATHVGHAATYVTFDLLKRRLLDRGHTVRCVRNITDVDDDLLGRAATLGVHYLDLATEQLRRFHDDLSALNVMPMCAEPRATGVIPDIRGFIHHVLDAGHAYRVGGTVYFDVSTFEGFGEISGLPEAEMIRLAAERGGNPTDPSRRHPLDFVLWQPSGPGEPAWDSPWGAGRPGWHIQCSALAMRELGVTVDIHGGGRDLLFPHHECERAQSESVTGVTFVRHWMHQGLVRLDGEKMSKSLGNLVFVDDLCQRFGPAAVRVALLGQTYRDDWDWDDRLAAEAATRIERWGGPSGRPAPGGTAPVPGSDAVLDAVRWALDDDLDAPAALRVVDEAAATGASIDAALGLLGVDLDRAVTAQPRS